ncbi:DUF4199 domain-containing protein [Jiulongibacter sediminis]|uniref:DUF4199 domain-containing protein n=1 Tax=Jiulongibacter sediminis TaxID=1605367 RepID=UPI0026F314A8|nr:DUF4199 domain-containing protein [Jiulongibacter sediminis]
MKKKILKLSLTWGLIAGLVCFLFFLMMYAVDDNPLIKKRPDIGINILFIFLAIWIFKRRRNGYLHFYEGFSIGFLTNLIAALFSGIAVYLFLKFYDIQPYLNWNSYSKQFLIEQKEALDSVINEETFKLQLKSFDEIKPYRVILDDLMFKQFAIVAIMLISMALRKQGDAIS